MKKIAVYISNKMVSKRIIRQEQSDLFRFAIEVVLSHTITFISIIIRGIILNKHLETVIFLIMFCSLRAHSNGYHAKTFCGCFFLTNLSFMLCVFSPLLFYEFYMELIISAIFVGLLTLEVYRYATSKITINPVYIIFMIIDIILLIISRLFLIRLYPIILSILLIVVLANYYSEYNEISKRKANNNH